jgi:hypothetical protein
MSAWYGGDLRGCLVTRTGYPCALPGCDRICALLLSQSIAPLLRVSSSMVPNVQLNMPPEMAPSLHQCLCDDLAWASKEAEPVCVH